MYGQYAWRFSPSYTFDAPAFSKADLASRAWDYRRFAYGEYHALDFFQFDTKHTTSMFSYPEYTATVNGKGIHAIIEMYLYIKPEQGRYTVIAERCDASVWSGNRLILDNEILRADDSIYRNKLIKAAVTQIKTFIQEQFDGLIPKIREIMENPIDRFQLDEINPTTY
jgi:hypothetical protein